MIEVLDLTVEEVISKFYGYSKDNIIFAPEKFAMRVRTETTSSQELMLPFVSYYRTKMVLDTERYRHRAILARGVPIAENVDGTVTFARLMPVNFTYTINFWTKDVLEFNQIVRNHFFKVRVFTAIEFFFLNEKIKLDMNIGEMNYGIWESGEFGELYEKGVIYNPYFELLVRGYIVEESLIKGKLKSIKVNIYAGEELCRELEISR